VNYKSLFFFSQNSIFKFPINYSLLLSSTLIRGAQCYLLFEYLLIIGLIWLVLNLYFSFMAYEWIEMSTKYWIYFIEILVEPGLFIDNKVIFGKKKFLQMRFKLKVRPNQFKQWKSWKFIKVLKIFKIFFLINSLWAHQIKKNKYYFVLIKGFSCSKWKKCPLSSIFKLNYQTFNTFKTLFVWNGLKLILPLFKPTRTSVAKR
jgi:hypothetical protein